MFLETLIGLGVLGLVATLSEESEKEEKIKVIKDADGRPYEFRFVREDNSWKVYVVSMPWDRSKWEHYTDHDIHLFKDRNEVCLSTKRIGDFETAYKRTVLWANGFSFLMEHGLKATKKVIPEW